MQLEELSEDKIIDINMEIDCDAKDENVPEDVSLAKNKTKQTNKQKNTLHQKNSWEYFTPSKIERIKC